MNYPQEDHPEVSDDLKHVFDEIAAELADALRNIKAIERGTTKNESQKIADQTVRMIRRAGEQCARFGIRAKSYLEAEDPN